MKSYLNIQTPLDSTVRRERKFDLYKMKGEEGICLDFTYRLYVSSQERLSDKETNRLIGNLLTVRIDFSDEKGAPGSRYINGLVYQVMELGMSRAPLEPQIWRYELEISSWLRQLDYVKDCRIFQKNGNTSISIVSDLLFELGYVFFRNKVGSNLPRRDYSVLYNETIGNYLRRILHEDGIIWYFEHMEKKHVLVFTDDSTTLPDISGHSSSKLHDSVKSFHHETTFFPVNTCLLTSYVWDKPPALNVSKSTGHNKATLSHFQYPGQFADRNEGEKKANQLKFALNSKVRCFYGNSTMRSLAAGCRFELFAPTLTDLHQKSYLTIRLKVHATRESYENRFTAVPGKQHYFPLEVEGVQKPVIMGSQTAVVVGEGEKGDVKLDRFGRVKVNFHWNHHTEKKSSQTSAFIRVAQPAAGGQRGFLFTPRIGEEVIVSFENGDPDKPLITGSVYSQDHPTPNIDRSASMAEAVLNDLSSNNITRNSTPVAQPHTGIIKSDGDGDANRIVFKDETGLENLEINAKKDMKIEVGHDLNIDVEEDIFIYVNNESVDIKNNIKTKAGGNIINSTLGPMSHTAGSDILNMALGGVFSVAGGLISDKAGKTLTNTAMMSVDTSANGAICQIAGKLLANNSSNGIINSGKIVSHKGDTAVINISLADIINNAVNNINHKTTLQKSTIDESSTTETGNYKIKGMQNNIN